MGMQETSHKISSLRINAFTKLINIPLVSTVTRKTSFNCSVCPCWSSWVHYFLWKLRFLAAICPQSSQYRFTIRCNNPDTQFTLDCKITGSFAYLCGLQGPVAHNHYILHFLHYQGALPSSCGRNYGKEVAAKFVKKNLSEFSGPLNGLIKFGCCAVKNFFIRTSLLFKNRSWNINRNTAT